MAGDDFKMQPPARGRGVPARTWQAMLAAQRLVKNRAHDTEADLSVTFPSTGIIYIRNDSGGARSQFDVLGLDVPLVLPSANLGEFQRRVTFSGVMPGTTSSGRFCVLQQALPSGAIGRALVDGVTVGRLLVGPGQESFGCADAIPGLASALGAVEGGSGTQILWKEAGDGTVNAVFRVGPTCALFPAGSGSGGGCGCTENPPVIYLCPGTGWGNDSAGLGGFLYLNNRKIAVPITSAGACTWYIIANPSFAGGVAYFGPGSVSITIYVLSGGSWQVQFADYHGDTVKYDFTVSLPDCCETWTGTLVAPDVEGNTPATVSLAASCGPGCGSGSGSGSASGGSSCCDGACTGDLSATITGATGCYASLPALLSLRCINAGGDIHYWFYESPSVCGGLLLTVSCVHPDGSTGSPMLYVQRGTTSIAYTPQAGWTCSPFSAVYDVDDGAGDTMTVTVT